MNKKIKTDAERFFSDDKTLDPNSKEAQLLKLLPYMSKEQIHELVEEILANNEAMAKIDLLPILSFFTEDECGELFKKCIELKNPNVKIADIVPYVNDKCLAEIVTGYIEGKYPDFDIDSLYPFLPDEQIKRIFYHIIQNEGKNA